MDTEYEKDSLRDRLIVAGIDELATHSVENFSLRRVAAACGTSCAAPYRHFENKERFLVEILRYIEQQWELLRDEVLRRWAGDARRCLVELSMAYIRFTVANPHYRRIMAAAGEEASDILGDAFSAFCRAHEIGAAAEKSLAFRLSALLHGTVYLIESGELANNESGFCEVRAAIRDLLASHRKTE